MSGALEQHPHEWSGAKTAAPWMTKDMSNAFVELEHAADLFLEIRADDLPGLFENALYAFYCQVAELDSVGTGGEMVLEARGASLDDALRALLAEALFRFETEGFIGAAAEVTLQDSAVDFSAEPDGSREPLAVASRFHVVARLWGEEADRRRHALLAEVKAVTYHRLKVSQTPDRGWRATVLFDL